VSGSLLLIAKTTAQIWTFGVVAYRCAEGDSSQEHAFLFPDESTFAARVEAFLGGTGGLALV
jgi:hypothetical protein